MRVQVIRPFHWDGLLRVRGDVLSGESAEQVAQSADHAAFVTPLADDPPAKAPVITQPSRRLPADESNEE